MSSSSLVQSPLSPHLKSKTSKSSLREAGTTPLSRLRNKLFAVKAFQSGSRSQVNVFEITHTPRALEGFVLSSPTERDTSRKSRYPGPPEPAVSPFIYRELPDAYLRQALPNSNSLRPPFPYTPVPSQPCTPAIVISKPLPLPPIHLEKECSLPLSKFAEATEWRSPRFILAVDPNWDPTTGEATLYIFPQDPEDLHGDAERISLEEIWSGCFSGYEQQSSSLNV